MGAAMKTKEKKNKIRRARIARTAQEALSEFERTEAAAEVDVAIRAMRDATRPKAPVDILVHRGGYIRWVE